MVKKAKYQGFREQAKKDRAALNKKLNAAKSVASLSDGEIKEIVKQVGSYSNDSLEIKTLDDGTKCFTDGQTVGVFTENGIFSTPPSGGYAIKHHEVGKDKVEYVGWLEDDNLSHFSADVVKLRDAAVAFGNDTRRIDELTDLAEKATLPERIAAAEKSSVVRQAKDIAVKSLGFDESTLKVEIFSQDDIGLVAKDGFGVGSGDTFYFVPNAQNLNEQCALREVKLSESGAEPVVKDIPLNEDTAKLVDEVYNKLYTSFYDASEGYLDQINNIHQQANDMWQEKEQKEKDAKEYDANVQALGGQFQQKVKEDEKRQVYRVGHFGNNMAYIYSQYATIGDENASSEERKKALDSLTKKKKFWKGFVSKNNSSSLKVELKNVRRKEYETFEAKKNELTDASAGGKNDTEDNKGVSGVASYSPVRGVITMNELTEEAREKLRAELKQQVAEDDWHALWLLKQEDTLYKLNDTMAQLSTLYHENNHKNDFDNSGGMNLCYTPKNAAKVDRLTETKSCAVEYLAMAHQYTELKKKGVETVEINGEKKPIEYMLDMKEGLREVIDKHGFDANNPESVRRVVEASSKYWHEERIEGYNKQAAYEMNLGLSYLNSKPMSEQLKLLKDEDKKYQQASETMLKNTYIGQNTVVDLSHCRDLLDTMTDADVQKIGNGAYVVSYKELKSVNDYLDKKGLKKDSDKMGYLAKHMKDLGYRKEDKDPELTQLLLEQGNTILCADGLEYSRAADGSVICHKDGKEYAITQSPEQKTPEKEFTISAFQQQNTR